MMQRMLEIPACWHCLMLSQQVLKNAYMSISGWVPAITKGLNNSLATCTIQNTKNKNITLLDNTKYNTEYQEHVHYITANTGTSTNDTLNCWEHDENIQLPSKVWR